MMPTQKAALERIDFEQYPIAQVFIEEAIPVAGSYPVFADWPRYLKRFSMKRSR